MKLLFFFLIISSSIFGQGTGEIHGTIVDKNSEPEPFVKVHLVVSDQSKTAPLQMGAITDFDGQFRIQCIDIGVYDLVVASYDGNDLIIEDITVKENEIFSFIEIELAYPEIISCDFGFSVPKIKETMDPFGRSITITSEDIKMR